MKSVILSAMMVSLAATSALAQDEAANDSLYLKIGFGTTFVSDWDQDVSAGAPLACQAIGCNPDSRITEHGNGFVAGGALGFDYADGIRTELEYRFANIDVDSVNEFEQGVDVTPVELNALVGGVTKAHFLLTNFYFDFTNDSPITPFIGGGVGGAFVEAADGERDAALAYQGRAGVAFSVAESSSFDLEYIYLRTNDLDFDSPLAGAGKVFSGEPLVSSSAMLSFRQHF